MSKYNYVGCPDTDNPVPLKQPFLALDFTPNPTENRWLVDIEGRLELYLNGGRRKEGSGVDRVADATPLLKALCRTLKEQGFPVYRVGVFSGTPVISSHVLRHGVFFVRMQTMSGEHGKDPTWMDE